MNECRSANLVSHLREMSMRDCCEAFDGHDHHMVAVAAAQIELLKIAVATRDQEIENLKRYLKERD